MFKALVNRYAPLIGLSDWKFSYSWRVRDKTSSAEADIDFIQQLARTYWNTHSEELFDREEREQIVLHELLHCHTRGLRDCFLDLIENHVRGEDAKLEAIKRFTDHEELLVGRLSNVFHRLLEGRDEKT